MTIAEGVRNEGRLILQDQPHAWFISGFSPQVWGGGGEEAVGTTVRHFADKGIKVSSLHGVIYNRPQREEVFPENLEFREVPQSNFLDFKGFSLGRSVYFQQLIKSDRPDLVVINMPGRIGFAAALALSTTDIPTCFWWHGTHVSSGMQYDYQDSPGKIRELARKITNPLKTIGIRKLVEHPNFTHAACSEFTSKVLEDKGLMKPGSATVLNPPTTVGLGNIVLGDNIYIDGAREDDLIVFIPARVAPDKQFYNVRELLSGLQVIANGSKRINFVSAGPAPSPEYLRYAFPTVNTATVKTTHLGVLDKGGMERVYSRADCVLMPNREEPFGLATVEAMRFGLPVLGFNSGGTAEILREFPDYPKYLIGERRGQIGIDRVRTFLEGVVNQRSVALNQRDLVMRRFDPAKLSDQVFQFVTFGGLGGNCTRV